MKKTDSSLQNGIINRTRLEHILSREVQVTIVKADAGFGKTTAIDLYLSKKKCLAVIASS